MKLNIESSRIFVLVERVTGSSGKPNIFNGKRPAAPSCFVAAVYVGTITCSITKQCLHSSKPAAVKVSLRTKSDIQGLTCVLMVRSRSNLVDHLVGSLSASAAPSTDVIYYYCDYADQRTLHHTNILGSLLKQLFLNHQISEHIETQLLQLYAGGTRSPAEKDLSDIFYSVVKSRPKLYIIFDGLDECEKPVWKAMLKILEHLGNLEQCTVKIFLTCVEEDSISHHLANYGCVQLSPAATAEDIKSYVTSSVRSKIEGGELRIRNSKLQQDIITELSSRANGM